MPKGDYGAGTVQIRDHGTYEGARDAEEQLARGELKFTSRVSGFGVGSSLSGRSLRLAVAPHPSRRRTGAESNRLGSLLDRSAESGEICRYPEVSRK